MSKINRDYAFHYSTVSLHQHLQAILARLDTDVRPYIELVQKHALETNIGIGNFAIVRMLAPVIETLADAQKKSAQDVLNEIGINYAHLYWSLFRDVFAHSDEFEYAYYVEQGKTYRIEPAVGIAYPTDTGSHTTTDKVVMLTVTKLFWDLLNYIKNLIITRDDKQIKIKSGIEYYPEHGDVEVMNIVKEMKAIHNL